MEMKGTYKLSYTIDNKPNDLIVEVKLVKHEGMGESFQNIYYGVIYVDGHVYEDRWNLSHCVNAKLAVEEIGNELKEELKKKLRSEGKAFRLKEII
jgi:hypothetical protein